MACKKQPGKRGMERELAQVVERRKKIEKGSAAEIPRGVKRNLHSSVRLGFGSWAAEKLQAILIDRTDKPDEPDKIGSEVRRLSNCVSANSSFTRGATKARVERIYI